MSSEIKQRHVGIIVRRLGKKQGRVEQPNGHLTPESRLARGVSGIESRGIKAQPVLDAPEWDLPIALPHHQHEEPQVADLPNRVVEAKNPFFTEFGRVAALEGRNSERRFLPGAE